MKEDIPFIATINSESYIIPLVRLSGKNIFYFYVQLIDRKIFDVFYNACKWQRQRFQMENRLKRTNFMQMTLNFISKKIVMWKEKISVLNISREKSMKNNVLGGFCEKFTRNGFISWTPTNFCKNVYNAPGCDCYNGNW